MNIKILFEDNHLLVAVKPHGILSQGDVTGDPDMLGILKDYIKVKYRKPGDVYLGLVHRLDRPAGGAMVFARTSKAASRLSEQMRTGGFGKVYLAVVYGRPQAEKAGIESFLVKDARTRTVRTAGCDEIGARKAELEYEVLDTKEGLSLLKIMLKTGRAHQIRVQISEAGCPVFGDMKYGGTHTGFHKAFNNELALWSWKLEFQHPVSKEKLSFSCAPPESYPWKLFSGKLSQVSCLPRS